MNTTLRRVVTVAGSTAGAVALMTGTALAHYCYRSDVPQGSRAENGQAWIGVADMQERVATYDFLPEECRTAVIAYIGTLPENTLFMGPGLLAGGAAKKGQLPEHFGHLAEDAQALTACRR